MILSMLILSLSVEASIDTLFYAEFSSIPFGWEAGPLWQWTDESAHLGISCGSSGMYVWESDWLFSPTRSLPYTPDSLRVVFEHEYNTWGVCHAPFEWCQTTMSLFLFTNSDVQELIWEICYYDEFGLRGFSGADSCSVDTLITGAQVGDNLTFAFLGKVEAEGEEVLAAAYLHWDVFRFYLLSYSSFRLEQSTWGSIKASI